MCFTVFRKVINMLKIFWQINEIYLDFVIFILRETYRDEWLSFSQKDVKRTASVNNDIERVEGTRNDLWDSI